MDAAKKRLEQSLMDRSIRTHDQIKQLHREAIQILDDQKKTKKSHRKSLVQGGVPLELKNVKKIKKQIGALVQEKMLSLALLREAEEYAMRELLEGTDITPQKPVSNQRRLKLLQDFVDAPKPEFAPRESIALLAAKHMLENGFEVEKADIPNLDSSLPELERKKQEEALSNEIQRYRERRAPWANEVADLLEAGKFKEARIIEDLARDSQAMGLLGGVRDAFADNAWDKFLKKQRKKVKKGKKLRTQNPGQKKISRRGPSLRKTRPQTYLDRIRPWRGDQTRIATAHAKQMISLPQDYDGNIQSREDIIEQTLAMLQSKYRELAQDHNAFQLQEIRDFLEKNVHDRRVGVTNPVIQMKRPLAATPLDTELLVNEVEPDDNPLSTSNRYSDGDMPQFDTSALETGSVISTDLGKVENLEEVEKEDVFEATPPPRTGFTK